MAQNLLDPDPFSGNNGDLLTVYSANWVLLDLTNANSLFIRGTPGVGANSNIGQMLRNGFTWTNDQWAELKMDGTTVPDTRFLVGVRCTQGVANSATGYVAGVNRDLTGGTYEIYKLGPGPGTYTLIQTSSTSYAVNDVVNFQAVGTTLTLLVNGASAGAPVTDATYSTGSPAMILGDSTTNRLAGTWNAGSVTSGKVTKNTRAFPLGMDIGMEWLGDL